MSGGGESLQAREEMSDDVSINPQAEYLHEEHQIVEPSVGQRLRAAREVKGLSLAEVSERLKLSPRQVEALEADDWSRLQCNTIMRGFVRNYARLLGLDPAEFMAVLDRIAKPQMVELAIPDSINVQVPDERGVERRDYARVFGGLAVLAIAVLAYFFLPQELLQSTISALKDRIGSSETKVARAAPVEIQTPPTEQAVATPTAIVLPSEPVAATPSAVVPSTPVAEVAAPTSKVAVNVLKFGFAKPAWVEVRDRSGQIVFSQLSPAGSQREVNGQPPFSLVIGNAGHVTLQYKGKDIDLSKRSKDDVARVTLE